MPSKSKASSSAARASAIAPSFYPASIQRRKKSLDEDHLLGDEPLEFGIMGRQLQRRVDEHAAAALLVINRPLDVLVEIVRIATDGPIDDGYRYSQLHAACLRGDPRRASGAGDRIRLLQAAAGG